MLGLFDTRFHKVNGKYIVQYKIKYWTTEKKKDIFGIPYKKKVQKVRWVDWKTYKKYKYRPIRAWEERFF